MTTHNLLFALGVGSALIAFWIALRFPDHAPHDFQRALVHVVAALAAGWVAPYFTGALFPHGFGAGMVAVFAVLMPVLIYTFLAGAWFLKLAHDRISHYGRR